MLNKNHKVPARLFTHAKELGLTPAAVRVAAYIILAEAKGLPEICPTVALSFLRIKKPEYDVTLGNLRRLLNSENVSADRIKDYVTGEKANGYVWVRGAWLSSSVLNHSDFLVLMCVLANEFRLKVLSFETSPKFISVRTGVMRTYVYQILGKLVENGFLFSCKNDAAEFRFSKSDPTLLVEKATEGLPQEKRTEYQTREYRRNLLKLAYEKKKDGLKFAPFLEGYSGWYEDSFNADFSGHIMLLFVDPRPDKDVMAVLRTMFDAKRKLWQAESIKKEKMEMN